MIGAAALLAVGLGSAIVAGRALRAGRESAAIASTLTALEAASSRPTPVVLVEHIIQPTQTPQPPTATDEPTPTEAVVIMVTPTPAETTATASPTQTNTRAAAVATEPATAVPPTETPVPAVSGPHGVTGAFAMCDPGKPSYAAEIEAICFIEEITNTTGVTVPYGWLGVHWINLDTRAEGDHTSWQGDLHLAPNCAGPSGTCGGAWRDSGLKLTAPGTYQLNMAMCFSSLDSCTAGAGEWETFQPGATISVISWTPSP